MLSSDSNDLTATTTAITVAATTVTPNSTEIEVDQETQKFYIAQENIPAACEESKHRNRLLWNRGSTPLSKIRAAAVVILLVLVLTTSIAAICSGDISKLSATAVTLYNFAQALALNNNGTATTSKHVF